MEIIDNLQNLKNLDGRSVVTIGNFDGVHAGHRELINEALALANVNNMNPVVLTFDPLPEEFFERKGFFKLMPIADKLEYFRIAGIKTVIKVPFSKKFSETSAPTFVQEILINKLQTKYLIVGEDFKFGRNREGNYNTLSNEKKFKTKIVSVIKDSDMKISSSMIRDLIVAGDIEKANGYLINEFAMDGYIVHGEKMGRKLGYPTANIEICKSFPINGIFLVKVVIENTEVKFGLASIGNKPTFSGKKDLLEVFIFDYNSDIYGKKMKVYFFEKLRNQIKFKDENDLIRQMNHDSANARNMLKAKYGL
tara:strand:+ start:1106 stop:2029 length:924 start_codon:yes stop_codon:yes gene_type:complete